MIERLVIFGAAGDLTSRYLLPALARLHEDGHLPDGFRLDAISRDDLSTDAFRDGLKAPLERHAGGTSADARRAVLEAVTYHRADATDPDSIGPILGTDGEPVIVYLALPPGIFHPVVEAILACGIGDESRLVVEKPHGEDLDSTRSLNALLHKRFPEESIFRIDHFLGHQTVQNLLGLRFGNRLFEPVWNAHHVASIEIRFDETLALEGRAGYYDRTGALKDMLQNHLLQLLCFVAMEPPLGYNPRDLRDKKVELLRAVRTLSRREVEAHTIRARYTAGRIGDLEVPSYVEETDVDPEQDTETFAQVTLFVDNWRWAGTPFILRSGKALASDRQEVVIRFRETPFSMFRDSGRPRQNSLRLTIDPDRMSLGINLNGAGDPIELEAASLDLDLAPQRLPAYARLLLDLFDGDATLSVRADEAEEAWRIVAPILEAWQDDVVPMRTYEAGREFEPDTRPSPR